MGPGGLNPLVGMGGVQRVYATKLNRGATPEVLIQNPVVPFFDPYNHDFTNSSSVADNQAGIAFPGGWTALHAAAEATEAGPHGQTRPVKGDLDEMRFLLNGRGHHVPPEVSFPHVSSPPIDVNAAMTKSKFTPLHIAVRAGHTEALQLLLKHGALSDSVDYLGRTPLHHAAERGFTECLDALLIDGNKAGALNVNIISADIITLDGPDVSPRRREKLELWAEVTLEQEGPIDHPTHKSSVQVDTMNPIWNSKLSFRCVNRGAKLTIRLMFRHAGMTKKDKDLLLGSFSCPIDSAIEVTELYHGKPFTVPLDSAEKIKEREKQAAAAASASAAAAAAAAAEKREAGAAAARVPSSGAIMRVPSAGGTVPSRVPSITRVSSRASEKLQAEGKRKKKISLAGAVGAVVALNRLKRQATNKGAGDEDEESDDNIDSDKISVSSEFKRLIDTVDSTGRSALMLASLQGSLSSAQALLRAGADPTLRDVFGSCAASLAAGAGHSEVCHVVEVAEDHWRAQRAT